MRHISNSVLALIFTFVSTFSTAQLDNNERDAIALEIGTALRYYHEGFSTLSAEVMADRIYGLPLLSVGVTGNTTVWSTREEVVNMLAGLLDNLRQQGGIDRRCHHPEFVC